MSRFTYRFVAYVVALALIGAGAMTLHALRPAPPTPADSPAQSDRGPESGAGSAAPASFSDVSRSDQAASLAAATLSAPALPAVDLPLADTIDELSARASAGDGLAACRLAVDLGVCATTSRYRDDQLSDALTVEIIARSDGDVAAREDMLRQRLATQSAHQRGQQWCAGISDAQIRSLPRFQWQAANAGHLQAARDFLLGGGRVLTSQELIANPEIAQLYQQHALPLFNQLLAQGEPVSVWVWSVANSGASTPIGMLLPPSMRSANVSAALMQHIHFDAFGETITGGTLANLPTLNAQEQALFDRYYPAFRRSDRVRAWAERVGLRGAETATSREERRRRALQDCESARWR